MTLNKEAPKKSKSSAFWPGSIPLTCQGNYNSCGGLVPGYFFRVKNPISATNKLAPIIDHITGNVIPPVRIGKISGRLRKSARPIPISAPINPITIDRKQPPRLNPDIACPIEPQIPAMINRNINSKKLMERGLLYVLMFSSKYNKFRESAKNYGNHKLIFTV